MFPDVKPPEFQAREAPPVTAGVVSWSPPKPNWNTWTGCNIDEGPLAKVCLFIFEKRFSIECRVILYIYFMHLDFFFNSIGFLPLLWILVAISKYSLNTFF